MSEPDNTDASAARLEIDRLRSLLSHVPAVIHACRADGRCETTFVTDSIQDKMGYAPEQFTSDPSFWVDGIHPDDRARVLDGVSAIADDASYTHEYRFRHADGSYRWIHDEIRVDRDEDGLPVEFVGCWHDITRYKRTEESLRAPESRLNAVLDAAVDGILTITSQGVIESCNPSVERLFGYPTEEMVGHNVSMLMPESDASQHDSYIQNYQASGDPHIIGVGREVVGRRRDGSVFPAYLAVGEADAADGARYVGILRDITREKELRDDLAALNAELEQRVFERTAEIQRETERHQRTAAALRAKADEVEYERSLFQALMNRSPDSICFKDTESRFVRVSTQDADGLGGRDALDLRGMSDFDFWPEHRARAFYEDEQRIIRGGTPTINALTHFPKEDQPDVWVSVTRVPQKDANGEIKGLISISRDVSDLMHTQQRLHESEAHRAELASSILTVQEEERTSIARELHDQIGQELASVLIGLRVVESAPSVEDAKRQAGELRQITSEAIEAVRRIAFDMRPGSLDDLGVAVTLATHLNALAERTGLRATFTSNLGVDQRLPPAIEVCVYRVVQAALVNVTLHARAESVSIDIRSHDESVSVVVADDGVGFDTEAVLAGPAKGRFGLLAMEERLDAVDGSLSIESQPGEGTKLSFGIPLPTEDPA
jgi:PAS domain S-box-containing protein